MSILFDSDTPNNKFNEFDKYSNSFFLQQIVKRRHNLWEKCKESKILQQLELEKSRRNKIHWINNWVYFYEPRNIPEKPALIPVVLYPKQEEFLIWVDLMREQKRSGIAEKTRGAGLSYLSCAYALHCWLFEDGFKAGFGSRVEDLVDRSDDPDSIFEKLRIILRHLPVWMRPKGFHWKRHNKFMRLVNPVNDSIITGEGGDNIGRGGRNTIYFIDEAAYLQKAASVDAALVANTKTVIYVSTPPKDATGNAYVEKRNSGKYPIFTFTWKDNLSYGREQYEKDQEVLDSVVFAREINLDYTSGSDNVLIPTEYVDAAIQLGELIGLKEKQNEKDYLDYQDNIYSKYRNYSTNSILGGLISQQKIAALDVAYSGKNKNVFGIREGISIVLIESWRDSGITDTGNKAVRLCETYRVAKFVYDNIGVGAGIAGILESGTHLFEHIGFNGSYECSSEIWEEFGLRDSKEVFRNLRAECGWRLRLRFEKTWEFVHKNKKHPPNELIAIPNHPELRNQLSQPKYFYTEKGLIQVESKRQMKSRGVESPDHFDVAMMLFSADALGFDFLGALTGGIENSVANLHIETPKDKITFLQQLVTENVHTGNLIRCQAEDYPIVRDILLSVAGKYMEQQDFMRWNIALEEIKRLDKKFKK